MKRSILLSAAMIVFVGAVIAGGTGAFFSDEETSTGNVLAAGDIDLQIDNESYYNHEFSSSTSWAIDDLTNQLFFNFSDLKPGDIGEDTISIHVGSNDAWVCMDVDLTATDDNGLTEPEGEDGDTTGGAGEGELQDFINFVWWNDDGDNVLEDDEDTTAFFSNTLSAMDGLSVALADTSGDAVFGGDPMPGDSVNYIAKAWCFGDLTLAPLTQDGMGTSSPQTPANTTGGVLCNGASVDNTSQTDSVEADITFRAVQARNNTEFLCGTGTTTPPTGTTTITVTKVVVNGSSTSPLDVSDFPLFVDGVQVISGVATTTTAGAHVVSETGTSTYAAEFSGDCDEEGNVTVPSGGSATCTITNTFIEEEEGGPSES